MRTDNRKFRGQSGPAAFRELHTGKGIRGWRNSCIALDGGGRSASSPGRLTAVALAPGSHP